MRLNPKAAVQKLIKKTKGGRKKDEHWAMMDEYITDGFEARRPFERRWIIAIAFLTGRQYSFFNSSAHMLQHIDPIVGRIRNVDNKLMPKWRRQVADLIKNDPMMSVVPETNEDEDIKAAKVGNKALMSFWRGQMMKKKIRQLAGWQYATGNCFMDDIWNPKSGNVIFNPETNAMEYEGDVECNIWTPFDILVPDQPMGASDLQDMPWMIKIKWRNLEWFQNNFKRGKEVMTEERTQPYMEVSGMFDIGAGTRPDKAEGALHAELYIQPNYTFPKGLFLSGANTIILDKQDYPYKHYHMTHFKDMDTPGQFWGRATLDDAIPLQRSWNRAMSNIDEFNRVMAKGKGLVPRGSKLDILPDNTHGEWIEYTPVLGHKPEIMSLKGLPSTYEQLLQHTGRSMEDMFSQHEVSRGTNKSDIRSGEMVSILREQDAHGNIPSHAVFEESLEELMARVLQRMQKGYTNERMLKVVGREGEFEVVAFKGADLRNNTDVSVKRQSTLPDSRVAREAQIMQRFEKGLYGDPVDPEVRRHVMNMLDDAVVKDIYSDTKLDEAYARFENKLMQDPKIDAYLVNDYDNHEIHVREHNHDRKSMEYQKIKLQDPQAFGAIEVKRAAHIKVHQDFINQAREQALKEQMMVKGGES